MCDSLHFSSMFSMVDRACGYLPFVPLTNIVVQTVTSIEY